APRIALVRDVLSRRLAEPARHCLDHAAAAFAGAGAKLSEVPLPFSFELALDTHQVIMAAEVAAVHAPLLRAREADYRPRLRDIVQTGALVPASAYLHAQTVRRQLREMLLPVFAGVD